jgi:transcriptional regulator with XRE-family HTH domain
MKLTFEDAQQIRQLRQQGQSLIELGARYGVSISTISLIVNNKRWVRPIPVPRAQPARPRIMRATGITLPSQFLKKVDAQAQVEGMNRSAYIAKAVTWFLDREAARGE